MGVGVTAGPIPKDFLQNSIPSLQVAASLPPPGAYLAKLDQTSRQGQSDNVVSNSGGASAPAIVLPDGSVPSQATRQAFSLESIGLPDGGVPPQASNQAAVLPQPHVEALQAPGFLHNLLTWTFIH